MPVIEPTDVRDEIAFGPEALGLDETAFDGLLEQLIRRETPRVEDAIDVSLGTETATETLSRPASVVEHALPFPKRPVQSVESVSIDTDRVGGPQVSEEDFVFGKASLELLPEAERSAWPTDRRAIEVEWTHGYPEGEVPDPVRGALIGLVRHALQEIESDGINSESIDGHSVNYEIETDVVSRHLARAKRFDEPDFYGGTQVI